MAKRPILFVVLHRLRQGRSRKVTGSAAYANDAMAEHPAYCHLAQACIAATK
jgi:hypothetical protein